MSNTKLKGNLAEALKNTNAVAKKTKLDKGQVELKSVILTALNEAVAHDSGSVHKRNTMVLKIYNAILNGVWNPAVSIVTLDENKRIVPTGKTIDIRKVNHICKANFIELSNNFCENILQNNWTTVKSSQLGTEEKTKRNIIKEVMPSVYFLLKSNGLADQELNSQTGKLHIKAVVFENDKPMLKALDKDQEALKDDKIVKPNKAINVSFNDLKRLVRSGYAMSVLENPPQHTAKGNKHLTKLINELKGMLLASYNAVDKKQWFNKNAEPNSLIALRDIFSNPHGETVKSLAEHFLDNGDDVFIETNTATREKQQLKKINLGLLDS